VNEALGSGPEMPVMPNAAMIRLTTERQTVPYVWGIRMTMIGEALASFFWPRFCVDRIAF